MWPATVWLQKKKKKSQKILNPPNSFLFRFNVNKTRRLEGFFFFFKKHLEEVVMEFILSVYFLFRKLGTTHVKILTKTKSCHSEQLQHSAAARICLQEKETTCDGRAASVLLSQKDKAPSLEPQSSLQKSAQKAQDSPDWCFQAASSYRLYD